MLERKRWSTKKKNLFLLKSDRPRSWCKLSSSQIRPLEKKDTRFYYISNICAYIWMSILAEKNKKKLHTYYSNWNYLSAIVRIATIVRIIPIPKNSSDLPNFPKLEVHRKFAPSTSQFDRRSLISFQRTSHYTSCRTGQWNLAAKRKAGGRIWYPSSILHVINLGL